MPAIPDCRPCAPEGRRCTRTTCRKSIARFRVGHFEGARAPKPERPQAEGGDTNNPKALAASCALAQTALLDIIG